VPEPAGDLWLGFRYVPPNADANIINRAEASFLEFYDANNVILAQIKPVTSTNRYHAIAFGGTNVQGSSSYIAPMPAMPRSTAPAKWPRLRPAWPSSAGPCHAWWPMTAS